MSPLVENGSAPIVKGLTQLPGDAGMQLLAAPQSSSAQSVLPSSSLSTLSAHADSGRQNAAAPQPSRLQQSSSLQSVLPSPSESWPSLQSPSAVTAATVSA